MPSIDQVVWRHAEDSAFLWSLRSFACLQPHFKLSQLQALDSRVDAGIDGLRCANSNAFELFDSTLKSKGPAGIFILTILVMEVPDPTSMDRIIKMAKPDAVQAVASALGWVDSGFVRSALSAVLKSTLPLSRRIAIAALAIQGHNLGPALTAAIGDEDVPLRTRACKAVGELGRLDLLADLKTNLADDDPKCAYYAAWSLAMRSDRPSMAISSLQAMVHKLPAFADRAAAMAVRRMDPAAAADWFMPLAMKFPRTAIVAAGACGDRAAIPWLIECMSRLPLARVAGEAFSMITGADISYLDLDLRPRPDYDAGPNDDPKDENVEMDPDGNLPWPSPKLVGEWWAGNKRQFSTGTRYLCGKPIAKENLQEVLRTGYQRQRAAAAIELAIRDPSTPLFNVRAPGFLQKQLLGL